MVWLELKQMVDVLGIAEQVLVGIFCMAVMEVTLGTAADRKTRIWKWVCVILSTAFIYQLMMSCFHWFSMVSICFAIRLGDFCLWQCPMPVVSGCTGRAARLRHSPFEPLRPRFLPR